MSNKQRKKRAAPHFRAKTTLQPTDAGRPFVGTISLCMIVKNEENTIARCLESVRPLVDEMIVVDTGSGDGTREIVKSFGAKVYDFGWTGSFSDARNFSLSKALCDWVLVLDADEVISPRDHEKLRRLINAQYSPLEKGDKGDCISEAQEKSKTQPPAPPLLRGNPSEQGLRHLSKNSSFIIHHSSLCAFSFVTRNYVFEISTVGWVANDRSYINEEAGTGWYPSEKVRLFPNDRRIHFENTVHEFVEPSLARYEIKIERCGVPIHHYGKLDKEKTASKWKDYHSLGKTKLVEKGEQDVMALYELAVQAAELKQYDEALEYWQKAMAVQPDFLPAFYGTGNIFFHLGRYADALLWYKKTLQLNVHIREAVVMCATCEIFVGDVDTAIALLEDLLNRESMPAAMFPLAAAYFCLDKKEKGREMVKKLGEMNFSCAHYFPQVAKVLILRGRRNYAELLLQVAIEGGSAVEGTSVLINECYELLAKETDAKGRFET